MLACGKAAYFHVITIDHNKLA